MTAVGLRAASPPRRPARYRAPRYDGRNEATIEDIHSQRAGQADPCGVVRELELEAMALLRFRPHRCADRRRQGRRARRDRGQRHLSVRTATPRADRRSCR